MKGIAQFKDNEDFQKKWVDVKYQYKVHFAAWVKQRTGIEVDPPPSPMCR